MREGVGWAETMEKQRHFEMLIFPLLARESVKKERGDTGNEMELGRDRRKDGGRLHCLYIYSCLYR